MTPRRGILAEAVAVCLGYLAVAIYATWPLARHPLGGFYGFGNDNWGGIWVYGELHDAYFGSASASRSGDLQAPFGYAIPDQVLQPMDRFYSAVFGGLGGGLGAYNAQIFISFILAGCTMYLLARYLTGSRAAAAVAGVVFTYSPFHLAMAMQYNSLAAIEWIPLYLLALIVVLRSGRRRDAALAGGAFALVMLSSYYYGWFVLWATIAIVAVFVVRLAVVQRRRGTLTAAAVRRFLRLALTTAGISIAVALLIVLPLALPSLRASQQEGVAAETTHPISEAVRYSARPWMLVLPPHDNPLAGQGLKDTVQSHLYDSPVYEQSIYLGYVALLLAVLGLWRRGSRRLPGLADRALFARGLLLTGGVAGLVIMMGPYLPLDASYWRDWSLVGETRHLPSIGALMFDLAPQFRFFVRAFVIVSACLAALAAVGFARVEGLLGPRPWARAVLAAGVIALIGVEFANAPPHTFTSAESPAWVRAVRNLPDGGPIVDYPLAPVSSPRSLYYIFWQTRHHHPTLNPSETDAAKALAVAVASPDSPSSGEALHTAGIEYAVVHTALPAQTRPPYQPALPDDSLPRDYGAGNPWFAPVARTKDAVIYRVLARPRSGGRVVARPGAGWGPAEPEAGTTARWLEGDRGTIEIIGADGSQPLTLRLDLGSFARPRRVNLSLDGRPLQTLRVAAGYINFTVPLGRLSAGQHSVELITHPGAEEIGNGDLRRVSVRLRDAMVAEEGS